MNERMVRSAHAGQDDDNGSSMEQLSKKEKEEEEANDQQEEIKCTLIRENLLKQELILIESSYELATSQVEKFEWSRLTISVQRLENQQQPAKEQQQNEQATSGSEQPGEEVVDQKQKQHQQQQLFTTNEVEERNKLTAPGEREEEEEEDDDVKEEEEEEIEAITDEDSNHLHSALEQLTQESSLDVQQEHHLQENREHKQQEHSQEQQEQQEQQDCVQERRGQQLFTANEADDRNKSKDPAELKEPKEEEQQEQQQREKLKLEPREGDEEINFLQSTNEHLSQETSPNIQQQQQQQQQQVQEHINVNISIENAKISNSNVSSGAELHQQQQQQQFDLEWEFDNEPAFERRQVYVKRNQNVRKEYELSDELGRGKFGTVYRCQELATGRKLAAKFVHMRRREDREDVEREIYIMSLLQHKRLLQLYDAFDDGMNEMCLICELVEGGELFERIVDDDFDLTERKAAIFVRQIVEAVDYMHSQSIVHLDMKPENILCVSKSGNRIKLIDFGLARQLRDGEQLRVMFGTPDFAAPEVLAYDIVSLATDMWSVGVICYVLLSGLSPFMGDNDMETMANVTRATYDFDDESFDPISDLAKDFISNLLVKEQTKRLKPNDCLQHPWLQKGGQQLEAAVWGRRRESLRMSNIMSGAQTPLSDNSNNNNNNNNLEQQLAMLAEETAFDEDSGTPPTISLDKRNLKKYVVRRKWHKTVHAIMALGRMGANLKFSQLVKS